MQNGIQLISEERKQQILKHSKTVYYDVTNNDRFQLSEVASLLAAENWGHQSEEDIADEYGPYGWEEAVLIKMLKKPYKERLIIAGALIAAELDRLSWCDVFPNQKSPVQDGK